MREPVEHPLRVWNAVHEVQPQAPGKVHMIFGGGFAPEFIADPRIEEYNASFRSLLAEVNIEDQGCTEAVFRGVNAGLSRPGHLSHLERPIYDFLRYIASRTGPEA